MRASIELIEQNLGYAWLPLPEINKLLDCKKIKPLNLTEGGRRSVSFYLNYLDKDRIRPATRELMRELRLSTMNLPR